MISDTGKIRVLMELRAQGITDTRVLNAMERTPREMFVPDHLQDQAWENTALPIGSGQTISQPIIVALMTARLQIGERMRVLEIGTGSGYQGQLVFDVGTHGCGTCLERARLAQDPAGIGQKHPAGLRQHRRATAPLEKQNAKLVLQGGDRLADRRMDPPQAAGRRAETPGFGHRREGAELVERHAVDHPSIQLTGTATIMPVVATLGHADLFPTPHTTGEPMTNIAIIYYSSTGNTHQVAQGRCRDGEALLDLAHGEAALAGAHQGEQDGKARLGTGGGKTLGGFLDGDHGRCSARLDKTIKPVLSK